MDLADQRIGNSIIRATQIPLLQMGEVVPCVRRFPCGTCYQFRWFEQSTVTVDIFPQPEEEWLIVGHRQ